MFAVATQYQKMFNLYTLLCFRNAQLCCPIDKNIIDPSKVILLYYYTNNKMLVLSYKMLGCQIVDYCIYIVFIGEFQNGNFNVKLQFHERRINSPLQFQFTGRG